MLQYLINVTNNTLAAAIVLAFLLLVATRPVNSGKKLLSAMAALGILAALIYAVLKRNTGFAVREYYDLGVMVPAIAVSLVFLILAAVSFRLKPEDSRKLLQYPGAILAGLTLAYCLPNIFLYPFEFAVGMESIYNADFLYKVMGYSGALLIVFLLGLAVYMMADKTPHRILLVFIFLALLVFTLQQALEVVQILVGRNMIPRPRWLMRWLITMLSHKNWFAYSHMILLAVLALYITLKVRLTALTGANPAQVRKMKADHRRQLRYSGLIVVCLGAALLTLTAFRSYANREVEISPPKEVAATDGFVILALEEVNDGNLHRHQYTASNGTAVRFIVIKKSESAYGVGLDACDICGPTGYYQRKDQVVCKLCDVVMNISTIGFPGGCNPVPLNFEVSEGKMFIRVDDLEAEKERFR